MTTPRIEEMVEEFWNKFSMYDLGYKSEGDEVEEWITKALTEAHQAGKIQALHLLEDLYAKAEDKAELIEIFNEALQDNK